MENVTSRSVCVVVVCGCVPGMLDVVVILSLLHKQNKFRNALFTPEQKKGVEKGGGGGAGYRGPPDHHTLDHSTQFILILKRRNNKSTWWRQGEERRGDMNGIIICIG